LGGDGVVAAGDIRSVADLKGRNVASEANIPARLLLQLALKRHGMSLEDLHLKEIATADTVPIFADGSIAAVASYEPFVSQAVKNDGARQPHVLLSSRDYPGMIVDVLAVRREDLAANPAKYRKLLIGIYKATAFFQADPAGFIRLAAPHYDISEADFRASIDGTLSYTPLDWAAAALGKPGAPGTLYGVFDQVMALNLENGAASTKLDAATSIDNSVIATIGPADLE
jgi:NitT/TauT family transport system substrate-binding protein